MTVILIIVITLIAGVWYIDSSYQARKIKNLKQENTFLLKSNQRLRDTITDIHSIPSDSTLDQYFEES